MSASTFHATNCYGRNAMLAQTVLHHQNTTDTNNSNPSMPPTHTEPMRAEKARQLQSGGLLSHKMQLKQESVGSTSSVKAKNKMIQFWQHIITQSQAPAARQGAAARR